MPHPAPKRQAVVLRARDQHAQRLMRYPNVVGVGVGMLGQLLKNPARFFLKVYVSKKFEPDDLDPEDRIPSSVPVKLTTTRNGRREERVVRVPTAVEEIGEIELQGG